MKNIKAHVFPFQLEALFTSRLNKSFIYILYVHIQKTKENLTNKSKQKQNKTKQNKTSVQRKRGKKGQLYAQLRTTKESLKVKAKGVKIIVTVQNVRILSTCKIPYQQGQTFLTKHPSLYFTTGLHPDVSRFEMQVHVIFWYMKAYIRLHFSFHINPNQNLLIGMYFYLILDTVQ